MLHKFSHESESTEPHVSLGAWHQEEDPWEHMALGPAGLDGKRSTGLGERETPL